jgi:hypothetical protein
MMRQALGPRLWTIGALLALAGCEQASFSSSPARPEVAHAVGGAAAGEPDASPASPIAAQAEASQASNAAQADAAQADAAQADAESPAAPAAAESAKPQGVKELTFDDIKFDIEKDGKFERSMLTDNIEALVDRTVRIRGYILPTFQQTGIRNFVLVRDNLECCFGPGAAIYDCIVVDMAQGASTDFTTRPVAVEGTFSIRELLDFDGVVRAVYHLEGKAVK